DNAIREKIEKMAGARAITVLQAVLAQLRTIGPRKLAVFTPYIEDLTKGTAADCIFLSCTNWRAIEAIETLHRKLGIPVVSSNQSAIDLVRQITATTTAE